MFVRLTYFGFKPEKLQELKKILQRDCNPNIEADKKEILNADLLEPADKKDDYISMTTWEKPGRC